MIFLSHLFIVSIVDCLGTGSEALTRSNQMIFIIFGFSSGCDILEIFYGITEDFAISTKRHTY